MVDATRLMQKVQGVHTVVGRALLMKKGAPAQRDPA